MTHQDAFETRMQILRKLALKPHVNHSIYDAQEAIQPEPLSIRQVQRHLRTLINSGYVIADNTNPRGYKINPLAFKSFSNVLTDNN